MAEGRFSKLERSSAENLKAGLEPPEGTVARKQAEEPKGYQPVESSYPTFIQQADESFFTGDYRGALRLYSRALQEENNHVYPWIGQVSALLALKQYREAEVWSNRALEQFPEDPSLLSQRARVLARTGNARRAVGVSDYAMQRGASEWAWLARGEVLLLAADGNALFCLEKAVELAGSDDWRVPLLAGLTFASRRHWSSAAEFLRLAVERNPRNFYIWYELARVYTEVSRFEAADDALKRALQLKPDHQPARELQTRLYRRPFFKRILGVFRR